MSPLTPEEFGQDPEVSYLAADICPKTNPRTSVGLGLLQGSCETRWAGEQALLNEASREGKML